MSNKLPIDLLNNLRFDNNADREAFVDVHEKEEKTNSVRINPLKPFDMQDLAVSSAISWAHNGFYLKDRPVFTLDPYFHAGCYYSQEASSMFLEHAIKSLGMDNPCKALDLCAAPGGKSTLLNSSLHPDSLLVSNEIIKSRVNILSDNLVRWGYPNVVVTNNDPSAFDSLRGYFNLLVVDAPCSGSGMFHKDHAAMDEWSLANVKLCSERQKRILASSIASLSTGGILFYSTCSYSVEENEHIVDWLIDQFNMETVRIPTDEAFAIEQTISKSHRAFGYRFYPHKVRGEGFFFAALRKKEESTFSLKRIKLEKNSIPQQIAGLWLDTDGLYTFKHNENLHVFPKMYEQDLKALQSVLYLKNAGTMIGKDIKGELVPSHDLALSVRIRKDLQGIEVDLQTALSFLRKETLDNTINRDGLDGWVIIRYNGINLGWIKALRNRINNYYPKEVRIAVL